MPASVQVCALTQARRDAMLNAIGPHPRVSPVPCLALTRPVLAGHVVIELHDARHGALGEAGAATTFKCGFGHHPARHSVLP